MFYSLNFSSDSVDKVRAAGASAAETPAEIASQCDRIVTMLPNSPHVNSVYNDANGLLSTASSGTLFLDCSTIDPAVAQQVKFQIFKKILKIFILNIYFIFVWFN